jgi:hypothetical protein
MDSKHLDYETFYKKMEKELNKRIHEHTNCLTFTDAFGKELENHLDWVLYHRKFTNKWIDRLGVPSKDEIAAIAVRRVDSLEKLDNHEETIYFLNKKLRENNRQLVMLKESLENLLCTCETELRNLQVYKIKSLENELEDLKRLFV